MSAVAVAQTSPMPQLSDRDRARNGTGQRRPEVSPTPDRDSCVNCPAGILGIQENLEGIAHLRGRGQLLDQYVASALIAVEDDVDGVAPSTLIHPHHTGVRQYSSIAENEIVDDLTGGQCHERRAQEATGHQSRQGGSWSLAVTDERKNNAL
jgi:hypothetical protein